ncbi:MAG: hypothetical protein AABP62_03210 [Planctomycetota bacterium]
MMIPLLAYFDPSTGSLLLQALVGGFGGVVVLGRYLWMQIIRGNRTPAAVTGLAQPPSPTRA